MTGRDAFTRPVDVTDAVSEKALEADKTTQGDYGISLLSQLAKLVFCRTLMECRAMWPEQEAECLLSPRAEHRSAS
jgi:hypothetical protein